MGEDIVSAVYRCGKLWKERPAGRSEEVQKGKDEVKVVLVSWTVSLMVRMIVFSEGGSSVPFYRRFLLNEKVTSS